MINLLHFTRLLLLYSVKKANGSRNRPGFVQRVPEGLGSQISWHSAREGDEVVSLTHRPPLPPGMFLVLIFTRGWVDPRGMVRPENSVTPPGIDPGTVRLVVQRFNHYAIPGLLIFSGTKMYYWNWRLLETLFCYTEFLHLFIYKRRNPSVLLRDVWETREKENCLKMKWYLKNHVLCVNTPLLLG